MGELWKVIQAHLDSVGVSEAEFSRRMDSSPQTLNSWKRRGLKQLPDRRLLESVASLTGVSYTDVLTAALIDIGYLEGRLTAGNLRRLVALSSLAESTEDVATSIDVDEEKQTLVADVEDLVFEVEQLAALAHSIAEEAAGGSSRLRELKREAKRAARARRNASEGFVNVARAAGERISKAPSLTGPSQGSQADFGLARRTGETEDEWRRRTEVQPEDENQDAGARDDA